MHVYAMFYAGVVAPGRAHAAWGRYNCVLDFVVGALVEEPFNEVEQAELRGPVESVPAELRWKRGEAAADGAKGGRTRLG